MGDAWRRLIQVPPVSTLLAAAAPSVDFAWHKYLAAHNAVVCAPTYSKCDTYPSTLALTLTIPGICTWAVHSAVVSVPTYSKCGTSCHAAPFATIRMRLPALALVRDDCA